MNTGRTSACSDDRGSLYPLSPSASHVSAIRPAGLARIQSSNSGKARAVSTQSPHDEVQSLEKNVPSKLSRSQRIIKGLTWFIVDQWFLLALGCLIILASQVQVPAAHQKAKETAVTYGAVAVIFFITGCTLPTAVLVQNYSRWKIHLFVQLQCFLMTSATTFAIVSACATNPTFMDPWLLIGMIFAGCVPTTISSNVVMTRQAHGNTALTVVQSTIGNFCGPFFTPLLIKMYTSTGAWYTRVLPPTSGGYGAIYRRVFKQLGLSLFLPMFVGQVVQNVLPKLTKKVMADWKLSKLGSLALLVIIWQTFDQAFETKAFQSVKGDNMVFIVFISIAFYLLWLAVSFFTSLLWLPRKDVVSVCYCVPAKTPAMGVPLTTVLFVGVALIDESKVQIPMVIFQGFQIVQGSLFTILFRKWMRTEEELDDSQKTTFELNAEQEDAKAEREYDNRPQAADNA